MTALLPALLLLSQVTLQLPPDFVPPTEIYQGVLLQVVTNGTSANVTPLLSVSVGTNKPVFWAVPSNSAPTTLIVTQTNTVTVTNTVENTVWVTNTTTITVTITNWITKHK